MMGAEVKYVPKVVGKQVYGSLYNCDKEILKDNQRLQEIVKEASIEGNMTLLDIRSWKIGEGVSVVAIILESHITIHTWPEYDFATVDVYSCGAHTDPRKAFFHIAKELKSEKYEIKEADRSSEF